MMINPIVTNYVDAALDQLQRLNSMRSPGTLPAAMRDDSIRTSDGKSGWKPIPFVMTCVEAALAQLRRLKLKRSPGNLPAAIRDNSIRTPDGWIGWKPIPSTVTEADLNELEQETGLLFPPLYRDFLRYRHFVELTNAGVSFEPHLPGEWSDVLLSCYFESWDPERIVEIGLLPFGSDTMGDSGPVCFDTRRRDAAGDCPVVLWDHNWVDTEFEVKDLFSSCSKMFECLTLDANNDIGFFFHDESDDPALLSKKQALLTEFLSLDTEGAGGAAREYWTCWGIKPAE